VAADAARAAAYTRPVQHVGKVELSPLADTIAQRITFAPRVQTWFTAAARGKRLLVDIGRVDVALGKDSARRAAFDEAVAKLAPVPLGAHFRLFGPWGSADGEVSGYADWNGRVVATLKVPPLVDSLARTVEPLPASALRTDTVVAGVRDACKRDTLVGALAERALFVRDSIQDWLLATSIPPYEGIASTVRMQSSRVTGCFGEGDRALVVVSLRAGGNAYVTERAVLLDTLGNVRPLKIYDLRLRAHDVVYAMDADGDGLDDVATRGVTERAGALSILKLDRQKLRLQRLTSGFAWEAQ
jgi:hypothetical protein